MAKAPKPGGAGTTGSRERASLRAKTVMVKVGEDVYRVPLYNLPMEVEGDFEERYKSVTKRVFSDNPNTSLKALWWLGRRLAGERMPSVVEFQRQFDEMADKAEDEPGFLKIEFPKFDSTDDAEDAEDDSPEA